MPAVTRSKKRRPKKKSIGRIQEGQKDKSARKQDIEDDLISFIEGHRRNPNSDQTIGSQRSSGIGSERAVQTMNDPTETQATSQDQPQWPRLQEGIRVNPGNGPMNAGNPRAVGTGGQQTYAGAVSTPVTPAPSAGVPGHPAGVIPGSTGAISRGAQGPVIQRTRQNQPRTQNGEQNLQNNQQASIHPRFTATDPHTTLSALQAEQERKIQQDRDDRHDRQMAKVQEALRRTRIRHKTKARNRAQGRRQHAAEKSGVSGEDSESVDSMSEIADNDDIYGADSATVYSETDWAEANSVDWERPRRGNPRRKPAVPRSSDLKPRRPKAIKNVDNIARVRAFVQDIKGLMIRYRSQVEIQDFIHATFWEQLTNQDPKLFRVGNTKRILRWFEKQVRSEERRMQKEPWKYAGKPKFEPKAGRSLYRSVELFLNKLKQHMRYVGDRVETRKLFLKRAVIQLPLCLAKLYDRIEYGGMCTLQELERELKANEGSLEHTCTPDEARQLRRDASDRLAKMKTNSLYFGGGETEGDLSTTSGTDSSSDDSTDRRRKHRHKVRRRRQRAKKKDKARNETRDTYMATRNVQDESTEDEVNADLVMKRKELKREIARQKQLKGLAELQAELDAIKVSSSVSSRITQPEAAAVTTSGNVGYSEEYLVDAAEIQQFITEEAKAEKMGLCFGCKKPGHIRANCPDLTNRIRYPRRLLGGCYNCGVNGHRWKECPQRLKPHLQEQLNRQARRPYRGNYYNNNYQNNPNPNAAFQNNRNYGNNRNFGDNRRNDQRPQQQQIHELVEERDSASEPEEVELVYMIECDEIEISTVDVAETKVTAVERKSDVKRAQVSYTKDDGKTWHVLHGKADSGADTTVGSLQEHAHCCLAIYDVVGQKITVRVAGGGGYPVRKKGLIMLKVGDKPLRITPILLVEASNWKNLLVGEDILQAEGLSISNKCFNKKQTARRC